MFASRIALVSSGATWPCHVMDVHVPMTWKGQLEPSKQGLPSPHSNVEVNGIVQGLYCEDIRGRHARQNNCAMYHLVDPIGFDVRAHDPL